MWKQAETKCICVQWFPYGHYPNKRNFMRLGSEASVIYNIL